MIDKQAFWSWAYSDFLSNAHRGVLAEFIVGQALGCLGAGRSEWDAWDLTLPDGRKIEVKSSAYLQSWAQKRHSKIRFDIAPKRALEADNQYGDLKRHADIYVFCVFTEVDRRNANPLDTDQWFFMVIRSEQVNKRFRNQKTVGLAALEVAGYRRLGFSELLGSIV